MKRALSLFFFCALLVIAFFVPQTLVHADDDVCSNPPNDLTIISKCLDDLTKAKNQSVTATKGVQQQINGIKSRVAFIQNDLIVKQQNIDDGYKDLAKKTEILNKTIADYYIKSSYNSPLLTFFSVSSAQNMTQLLAYQKAATDQDRLIISNIALTIQSLQKQKVSLEAEKENLAVVKTKLDKVVADSLAYQATLSSKIASLSAKQQEILGQRLSALGIPLFASSGGSCSSDLTNGRSAGFSGGFGFFTYGVPNRVGLNQYGAFGRAKAGQDASTILSAYYNFDSISGANQSTQITVDGYGTYSLEDYLKHIYEVSEDWGSQGGMEALKAQAIAARSYALAATNNGASSICATDSCQVFSNPAKTGNWATAVDQTAGQVMMQGGNPIKAWFSSTHGGYIHSSGDIGWSGTSWTKNALDASGPVNSFDDLKNNSWDGPSHANSPWFYCDWGTRLNKSDYGGTAWLKPDEVADIVNVALLARTDSSVNEHLYQTDRSNPAGTDTWDATRVRSELQNRGGTPYTSVSNISISPDFGSGKTTSVNVSGDGGNQSLSGDFFKTYFDLRAPGYIQIVGPLYNVERN